MFGTFEPEIEPVKFGLVKNVDTFNPIKITFMGWRSIMTDIKMQRILDMQCTYSLDPQ
jgi:hypothetical protein